MQVLLMLKYFCVTLLCLAIPTWKTVLKWIILAWNIFAWVCAMTDRLLSRGCLPQPPPWAWSQDATGAAALEMGGQVKVPARVWALRGAVWQGECASGRLVLGTKGQKSLSPARSPRLLGSLARRQLLPRQPGPWWLWDHHRLPRWNGTMGFSSSDWSGKSRAACGVPSASSCRCFLPVQGLHYGVLK